jgi:hypothetical protein
MKKILRSFSWLFFQENNCVTEYIPAIHRMTFSFQEIGIPYKFPIVIHLAIKVQLYYYP